MKIRKGTDMQHALITGASGAIGIALIRDLIAHGVKVTALLRPGSERNAAVSALQGVTVMECGLSELGEERIREKLQSAGPFDVFYHLAWAGTSGAARNDMDLQSANIAYTLDAVRLAHDLSCRRFIGVGSQAEYGRTQETLGEETPCRPENGYGIAKLGAGWMSRILCDQLGLEHVWTRVLSVYGPGDGKQSLISVLTDTLLSGESPRCTKGEQIWDYIFSGDAAEFLRRLADADADGRTFCIGSGRTQTLREYMEQVREAVSAFTGKAAPEIIYDRPYPEGQVMHLQTDITELSGLTGYMPETDFQDGILQILREIR